MAPVADALRTIGDVHVLEFPGHGTTALGTTPFSIEGFTQVVGRAVGALSAPPVVFGHSMGGYVALALELRAPRTFAGVVTLGTKFAWSPEVAAREAGKCDAGLIEEKVPRFARVLEERHAGAGGWQSVLERTATLIRAVGAAPVLTPDLLPRIACPVVLAVGETDDTVTELETRTVAGMLPHARAEVLPGVPHPIERVPAELATALVGSLVSRSD